MRSSKPDTPRQTGDRVFGVIRCTTLYQAHRRRSVSGERQGVSTMLFQRFLVLILIGTLSVALSFPSSIAAQGRGNGRDLAKKNSKFINGHDARDGRWDGRGPRRGLRTWTRGGRGRRGWSLRRHRRFRVLKVR